MKYNKLIFFLLCAILLISSCTSLPEGLATKTEVYNADNVDFYYDLNYETADGERKFDRQIWDEAYKILDEAQDFFLMDIFVFNDYLGKGVREKLQPIDIATEFAEKILEKKKKSPNVEIYLILDESNTFYGAFDNPTHKKLEEAGVKIGYVKRSFTSLLKTMAFICTTFWKS